MGIRSWGLRLCALGLECMLSVHRQMGLHFLFALDLEYVRSLVLSASVLSLVSA